MRTTVFHKIVSTILYPSSGVAGFLFNFNASMPARYPTDLYTLEAVRVVAFIAVAGAMATLKSAGEGAALNHKT